MKKTTVARLVLLLAFGAFFSSGFAQPSPEKDPKKNPEAFIAEQCTPKGADYRVNPACGRARFRSYEPNYAVYQWTQDDQSSLRAHYSFRYFLMTPDCITPYRLARDKKEPERSNAEQDMRNCFARYNEREETYLMYTGEFDFYLGTRQSGPVINRLSNPGLHHRIYHYENILGDASLRWIDIGFEHRSDGQTTDPRDTLPTGQLRAPVEYANGNHAYFDAVSVDTNYPTIEAFFDLRDWELHARAKLFYLWTHDEVTWGPKAGARMEQYDRFRFVVSKRLSERASEAKRSEEKRLTVEWTLGDQAFRTQSANIELYFPVSINRTYWPFFLRMHLGPLNTLSNYTKGQSSIGIGLLFME